MFDELLTPAVVANLDIVERNIKEMVAINARYGIAHRPHIKSHKSVYLAKEQINAGCSGITCAKLGRGGGHGGGGALGIY